LPSDWQPSEAHRAYAAEHAIAIQFEADRFRGWADGKTQVSWNGAFTAQLANRARWDAADKAKGIGARKGPVAQRGVHPDVNMDGDSSWLNDEPEQLQLGGGE
jgi:hypothetical protein